MPTNDFCKPGGRGKGKGTILNSKRLESNTAINNVDRRLHPCLPRHQSIALAPRFGVYHYSVTYPARGEVWNLLYRGEIHLISASAVHTPVKVANV